MQYTVQKTAVTPAGLGAWDSEVWRQAAILDIANFHERSSSHHPRTQAKLLYDDEFLYLHFRVEDSYVRAVHTQYQDSVCQDSCVEFFVQPLAGCGYFNFEVNCLGTILLYYMEPPEITGGELRQTPVAESWLDKLNPYHSLEGELDEEISAPTTWQIEYAIPFALFRDHLPSLPIPNAGMGEGTTWRANFYKCGDETSHPHWAAWSPIGNKLNFHQPEFFGDLSFAP